jgi:hypothetical protein
VNSKGDATRSHHLLVARFNATEEELSRIREAIKGEEAAVTDCKLEELADWSLIKQYYKIVDAELEVGTVEAAIVARIAARDVL